MKLLAQVCKAATALTLSAALLGGCDPSKEELEKTKEQLAKVTSERDQLKGQFDQSKTAMDSQKAEMDATKAKLTEAEAKLQACTPAAPTGTPVPDPNQKGPAKGKTTPKAAGKEKIPVAPKVDTAAPVGTEKNPVVVPKQPGGSY